MRTLMTWGATLTVAAANPGALDRSFAPELRTVAAAFATVAPDGKIWVSGGFDEAGGVSVGDWVVLGPDGGVARDAVPGYLNGGSFAVAVSFNGGTRIPLSRTAELFPLGGGGCLIPNGSGGWLRASPAGRVTGNAFPDIAAGESVTPGFERDGKLFVIRVFAEGLVAIERRSAADGGIDSSFVQSAEIPADPVAVVAGPDGKLWVLGESQINTAPTGLTFPPTDDVNHSLFRLESSGALDAGFQPKQLTSFRSHSLVAGPDGGVRVVMGPDQGGWYYWPAPEASVHRIEFYGAAGNLQRREDFSIPLGTRFAWAGSADGRVVATGGDGRLVERVAVGNGGIPPAEDPSFISPGRVSSVVALPDGKWLVDGHRRLLPDGRDDPAWTAPRLDRPAENRELEPMPGGRMLVAGNFSGVEGSPRTRLAVLRADGSLDGSFTPDPRVGEARSAAVQGDTVFAVTAWPVDLGKAISTNLVKLKADGSLDESFSPVLNIFGMTSIPTNLPAGGTIRIGSNLFFNSVHATADGKILVESVSRGEVGSRSLYRLNPDGTRDATFARWTSYNQWGDLLALNDGKVWVGGELLDEKGVVIRDLSEAGVHLRPLCEWQGGVLFLEGRDAFRGRLKLWRGRSWVRGFAGPGVGIQSLIATPGEVGMLYLQASFGGSRVMLRRLRPDGRIDTTFRAPLFEYRQRREGDWWTTDESGRVDYEPTADEAESAISAMRWDRELRRLWVAGAFNQVDGRPRDGIARIEGGQEGRGGRRDF